MRAWKALGVVETIYEEELFEDSTSSSSFLSPSDFSPLHSTIQAWSKITGRNPDVVIHVQGTCFHVHKDPLTSKSIYLRNHLTPESELIVVSPPLNISAETFGVVSEFCYGVGVTLTPLNVGPLRTAAEVLEMTDNLWEITESYFREAVGEYAGVVLRSCVPLLPDSAFLVRRCVEALPLITTHPRTVAHTLFQHIKTLPPHHFRALAHSMHPPHDLLYWITHYYLKEYEGELTEEQKIQICNNIKCNKLSPELLIHAVQNQLLPLRFLLRAMLVNTASLRQFTSPLPTTLGAILQRDAALRQAALLKTDMESTATRLQRLERELSAMKELCQLQYDNRIVDHSARSASFHYGTRSESKIMVRELNSSSCRFSDQRDVLGGSSSSRLQKNIRQRMMHGLKRAFRFKHGSTKVEQESST